MARFEHMIFVCTRVRPPGAKSGSCGGRGSEALLEALRDEVKSRKLKGRVRVTHSGCLDLCAKGCVVVAYRDSPGADGASAATETWYTGLTAADAPALFAREIAPQATNLSAQAADGSNVRTNRVVAVGELYPSTKEH